MNALGSLRSFSMPLDDRYAYSVSDWTGTHGGYTDIADDGLYAHGAGDWAAEHAPYTETDGIDLSSEASEVLDADDDVPSWQQMWTATHPGAVEAGGEAFSDEASVDAPVLAADALSGDYVSLAAAVTGGALPPLAVAGLTGDPALLAAELGQHNDLDDAFETDPLDDMDSPSEFNLSGVGSASLTIERGSAPLGHRVPNDTTSVIVSVPGTDIHQYVVFPEINPTLDITLPELPCGEQDVVVQAFSGTTLVGRGEFIVNVASPAGAPPDAQRAVAGKNAGPAKDELKVERSAHPAPIAPSPPKVVADVEESAPAPQDRESEVHDLLVSSDEEQSRFAPRALPSESSSAPSAPAEPRASAGNAASQAPREAPAPIPVQVPAAPAGVRASAFPPARAVHANPAEEPYSPGQALSAALASSARIVGAATAASSAVTGAEAVCVELGVPLVLDGAMEILAGFHRRDYDGVWRGALKSQAGGLLFAGSLMASPLLTAMGALLARAYERGT